jgi:RNA polymerase sigma-70 factor (ECF subfamily)
VIWRDKEDDSTAQREIVSPSPDPETLLSAAESEILVRAALATLPLKYRLPIVYAAIDGLDYPTVARMLGIPLGTVKTLIFRGKRMLRDEIARRLQAPDGN